MKILPVVIVIAGSWCVPVTADQTIPQSKPAPGAVALLVTPKLAADVRMLTAAVGDADPAVRAVAARVAGLLGRKDLATALLDLLEREQEITAASEQVRALLYLRGLEVLPQVKAASTRLGVGAGSTLAEWLARTHAEQFAEVFPDLLRDMPASDAGIFGSLAALAVRQAPAARERIAASVEGAASLTAWREFIDHLDADPDALVLKKGLGSSNGAIREATIWSIVSGTGLGRVILAADLNAAMNAPVAAAGADDTEWSTFGRELLARRLGKAAADRSATIPRQGLQHPADAAALASIPELTAAERSALRGVRPDLPSSPAASSKPLATSPGDGQTVVTTRLRTFPAIAPGLLGSLLTAVGCELPPDRTAFGAARILYHPDGRPRDIAVDTTTLKGACASFVEYLARVTVATPDLPVLDGLTQWLFIPMDRDAMDCADANARNSAVAASGRERIGGKLAVPHKTKDVKPVYPEIMRMARVSGVVIIQATITATGCVDGAEVLRSVQLPLDLAALKAVSGWRFEPTLLDGKPVPVSMTVTVNFLLR